MKKILFLAFLSLMACGKKDVCSKSDAELAKERSVVVNIGEGNQRWQNLSGEGYLEAKGLSGMQKIVTREYHPESPSVAQNKDRLLSKYGEKTTYILEDSGSSSDKQFIYRDIAACKDR